MTQKIELDGSRNIWHIKSAKGQMQRTKVNRIATLGFHAEIKLLTKAGDIRWCW